MIKNKTMRVLIAVLYTLAVTAAVGKWAIHYAYLERGYEAIGGEYCLILLVYLTAWKAINYLFNTMEALEYERNHKKRGSRAAARTRNNG